MYTYNSCVPLHHYVHCRVMEQSSTTFRCLRCPETRTSQRALNRHIKWHQRTANTAVAEPAVLSMDCVPSASRDLRVTSGLLEPPSILDDNPDQARKHRKLVDVAVGRLKRRHERDRTTLSLPTAELANWLVEKEPDLSLLMCIGIVVAAEHFAGSQSPLQEIPEQMAMERPAPPGPGPQELSKDTIRRRLFSTENAKPGPTEVPMTGDTVNSGSACERSEPSTSDDEWRLDIWRSYGSKEVPPPSPFGCQQSPSLAITGDAPPGTSPVGEWSESSDDEPWGPDSPEQLLQLDSFPDYLPHWPMFRGKSGGFLKRGGSHWKEEVRRWQDERTTATPRWKPRRRHPLRSRRRSRTRYSAAIAAIPPVQVHWTDAGAVAKPITPGDVELPSPPDSAAGLHRIRRVLLRRANLPTGCRLRKRKRPLPSDQEAIDSTSPPHRNPSE